MTAAAQNVVHPDDVESQRVGDADVRVTFDARNGCERLEQRVTRVAPGRYDAGDLGGRQAVLYVVAGRGKLEVDGGRHPVEPGTGAFVAAGETFAVRNEGPEELVLVGVYADVEVEAHAVRRKVTVRLAEQPELEASPERSFHYLINEDAGCNDVTQFLGIVQPSKAPFHSHPYDEVGYVVEGRGIAHVDGEEIPLRAGACFHLAPEQVHCIENSGEGPMRILGVFHPSGSPASRTYQDNK